MRSRNTNVRGGAWTNAEKKAVWGKATQVAGQDPERVRKDSCGALIEFSKHGRTDDVRGWEIDHKKPVSKGGIDDLSNLQPLQWKNNREKGDDWPNWSCAVRG